jgi:hypothetical protein
MESIPLSDMTGTILELYAADATTLLVVAQSSTYGESARIIWKSDRDDLLYLRVRHIDGNIAGNVVSYRLNVYEYKPVFLPIVHQE